MFYAVILQGILQFVFGMLKMGAENAFFGAIFSFCQDRLGINLGKLEDMAFSAGDFALLLPQVRPKPVLFLTVYFEQQLSRLPRQARDKQNQNLTLETVKCQHSRAWLASSTA